MTGKNKDNLYPARQPLPLADTPQSEDNVSVILKQRRGAVVQQPSKKPFTPLRERNEPLLNDEFEEADTKPASKAGGPCKQM